MFANRAMMSSKRQYLVKHPLDRSVVPKGRLHRWEPDFDRATTTGHLNLAADSKTVRDERSLSKESKENPEDLVL